MELYQQLQDTFSDTAVAPENGSVCKSTTGQGSPLRDRMFLFKVVLHGLLLFIPDWLLNTLYLPPSLSSLGGFSCFQLSFLCLKFLICFKVKVKIQLFHCKSFPA